MPDFYENTRVIASNSPCLTRFRAFARRICYTVGCVIQESVAREANFR